MIDGLPVIDGLVLLAMSVFGYRLAWIQRRIADEPDLEAEDHSWRLMTETSRSNMVAYSGSWPQRRRCSWSVACGQSSGDFGCRSLNHEALQRHAAHPEMRRTK